MAAAKVMTGEMPNALVELEKLLQMEDGLPHERVPTDDFFGEYLHGLSTLAAHHGSSAEPSAPSASGSGACASESCTPSAAATASAPMAPSVAGMLPTTTGGLVLNGDVCGTINTGGGPCNGLMLPAAQPQAPLQVKFERGGQFAPAAQQSAAAAGWPLHFAGGGGGGLVALPYGQPGVMPAGPAVVPLSLLGMVTAGKQHPVGRLMMVGVGAAAGANGKGGGGKGHSSSTHHKASQQRQATNRVAQKKYRERQKTRLLEMQVTIDRLQHELADRQAVTSHNHSLEEQHYKLQAQLARAETEAEALQWQQAQAQRERRQLASRQGAMEEGRGRSSAGNSAREGSREGGSGGGAVPMDVEAAEGSEEGAGSPPSAGAGGQEEQQEWEQQQQQRGGLAGVEMRAERQASLCASSAAGSAVGGADAAADGRRSNSAGGELPTSSNAACCGAGEERSRHNCEQAGGTPASQDAAELATTELAAAAVADPLLGMYGPPPPHEDFDSLLSRFQGQVARVKQFLDEHKLRMQDPSAVVLPNSLRGRLLGLVQESLGICRDLLRVEGVDVIELLQRQDEAAMGTTGALPGSLLRHKWLHVLQVLRLTAEQKQQVVLQRTAHLALMRRIYQQRQQLNMQAMSLMLVPGCSGGSGSGTSHATSGAQAAQLATVLRLIKENLRREQRASMEINSCTLCRILTPVQAALYVCEAFPLHCDALGMSNVLSTLGQADKTASGAGSAGTPGHSASTPATSTG